MGGTVSVITPHQRNALLIADRTREVEVVLREIEQVMVDNPFATLLDIEMVFRDAAANSYLVMSEQGELSVVFGMQAWQQALLEFKPDEGSRAQSTNYERLLRSQGMEAG
jgi:hypothetical protein